MTTRILGAALTTVTAIAVAASASVAATSSTAVKRTTQPTIKTLSGFSFVPNRYVQDKLRFDKDVYSLKSGATISLRELTEDEPHTVSVVSSTQVPRTARALGGCFGGGPCATLLKSFEEAHQFPPEGQEGGPAVPVVNVGKPGLDSKGDSVFLAPKQRTTVKLSARKGSTLNFICSLHPQMQAKITVR